MQQGSAADVAMLAMLEISKNKQLKELGWKLLLQVKYLCKDSSCLYSLSSLFVKFHSTLIFSST